MEKVRLTAVDSAFLRMQTRRTPMHTVLMHIFRMPPGAGEVWLHKLVAEMRETPPLLAPYNRRLENASRFRLSYHLVLDENVDIDRHLKYWAFDDPIGERELNDVLERVHTAPLDMKRPLWECHVVGNLCDKRFAILLKVHHAAQDGLGAIASLRHWLSEDPTHLGAVAPWALSAPADLASDNPAPPANCGDVPQSSGSSIARREQSSRSSLRSWWQGLQLMREMKKQHSVRPDGGLLPGMRAPRTPFNVVLSPRRNFARKVFELRRFRALSQKTGTTVNDVVISVVGGAVRYYLESHAGLPAEPLVVSIPVGLPRNDGRLGNQVSTLYCTLGTNEFDAMTRLEVVSQGVRHAKAALSHLRSDFVDQLMSTGLRRMTVIQFLRLSRFDHPFFNIPISNLVYGSKPLYLRNAQLEASFPSSVLFDNYALNVTIIGYADRLSMGFTGCPAAVPDLDQLADLMPRALDDLERAAGTNGTLETIGSGRRQA